MHGLSVAETGRWLGFGTGIVSGLGGMACGFIVDWVYRKDKDPTVWCDKHKFLSAVWSARLSDRRHFAQRLGLGYGRKNLVIETSSEPWPVAVSGSR